MNFGGIVCFFEYYSRREAYNIYILRMTYLAVPHPPIEQFCNHVWLVAQACDGIHHTTDSILIWHDKYVDIQEFTLFAIVIYRKTSNDNKVNIIFHQVFLYPSPLMRLNSVIHSFPGIINDIVSMTSMPSRRCATHYDIDYL